MARQLLEANTFSITVRTRAPILYSNLIVYPRSQIFLHLTVLSLSIGNLTMQQLILDDDRELTPSEPESEVTCQVTDDGDFKSDTPCHVTEDDDYYFRFVTFEVKGKAKSSFEEISNTTLSRLKIAYSASQAINSSKSLLYSARCTSSRSILRLMVATRLNWRRSPEKNFAVC